MMCSSNWDEIPALFLFILIVDALRGWRLWTCSGVKIKHLRVLSNQEAVDCFKIVKDARLSIYLGFDLTYGAITSYLPFTVVGQFSPYLCIVFA
ncbi:hypothetical protein L6452_13400 [Arctium lappa]|uniref:Uncharacterized protein n=1 Tax=Arctium lappa TaxID=4217 RepID=A0ACB9CI40_ARCLA|nr:hypothetical protein L6452_13400 [Arctium lappa]